MNTSSEGGSRNQWSSALTTVGSLAMLIGAVDPIEGSLAILPGSGLVALGAYVGGGGRRLIAFRLGVFMLIAVGVAAMWVLSFAGGFGGDSGRSMWWGLLVVPYLVGWSIGIWGPGSPRWVLVLGIVVGLWHMAVMVMVVGGLHGSMAAIPGYFIGGIGVLTIGGCAGRLIIHRDRADGEVA